MWHTDPNTQLVAPGDTAFWDDLWKSDVFRALLQDPASGYGAVVARAAQRPWWWFDQRQSYERRHFSVWFGSAIIRRNYSNPVIEDLFHWHEILHAMTFVDNPNSSDANWRLRMRADEVAVSLETEILLYWRVQGLRQRSFDFPIWHDALTAPLDDSLRTRLADYRAYQAQMEASAQARYERELLTEHPVWPLAYPQGPVPELAAYQDLWDLRRAVTLMPNRSNLVEASLAAYEEQSDPWCDTWRNSWREVETERVIFERLCAQGDWKAAVARRQQHWERVSNADGVPYGDIAKLS